ncbi:MAG: TRAP transporter large permease [Gracilibacteraceae bacterium]|jgi:tripartite ATP-independent transporter DctM subunit|nr:TRAP transporter large permease [Gracilibacteraceae bacterium]
MSPVIIGLLGILAFLALVLLGLPIATGMMLVGMVGFGILTNMPAAIKLVSVDMFSSFSSYNMSVVAMFAWMGFLAFHSGIGSRLYDFAYKMIGHWPGGLAMASEMACACFGAVCGSGPATTATIGSIAFPEMKKRGYDSSLYTACVASGGGLGLLIPPSMTAIVYGVATEQSIGRIFIAGIGAGILLMVLFMITIWLVTRNHPEMAPRGEKSTWPERAKSVSGGLLETLIIFIFSVGGLSAGWFTPTEGGAIGAFAMLAVVLVRRKLSWKGFVASLYDTAKTVGMVLLIVACATIFGRFIALAQIPLAITGLLYQFDIPAWQTMVCILVVYLIAGCFIDSLPMIMLTVPIFYPVVVSIGYDPIWFGVIITLVCCMGMITPPVGIDVYVAKNVAVDVPLPVIFKGIWPFLFAIFICIALIMIFPQIVLFLPELLMG